MKVLHIGPTPFFANRGCHIRILNEIRGLKRQGARVTLTTYRPGSDVDGVEVRRSPGIPGHTKTSAGFTPYRFPADILLYFTSLRCAWRQRPQILHGHLHEGGLLAKAVSLTLFWRRLPVVMDIQGSLSGELRAYGTFRRVPLFLSLFFFLERLVCRLPDHLVCSSAASRAFLIDRCGVADNRLLLLGDVVPDAFFVAGEQSQTTLRRRFDLPSDRKILLYSGSLLEGKGVDLLVEALPAVAAAHPDCFFLFVGYPVERVEQRLRELGLDDCSRVTGEVSYLELADWLATGDVAVDPKPAGSGEASGKILHYMAAGLPVVCFDTENNRTLLGEKAFYVDQHELSAGLCRALESGWGNTDSAALRERAATLFSLDAAGRRLIALYRDLVGTTAPDGRKRSS